MSKQVGIRREDGSLRVVTVFEGPSLTRQEFKEECDLVLTLKRFNRTPDGVAALRQVQDFVQNASNLYQDRSKVPGSYFEAQACINRSKEAFDRLPAILRKRFENDPAKFLDYVDDPRNLDEMRQLGLAKPLVEQPVKAADAAKTAAG